MTASREMLPPDSAAQYLFWGGSGLGDVAEDTSLAQALCVILPKVGVRLSRMPVDFDAIRSALADLIAGRVTPAPIF